MCRSRCHRGLHGATRQRRGRGRDVPGRSLRMALSLRFLAGLELCVVTSSPVLWNLPYMYMSSFGGSRRVRSCCPLRFEVVLPPQVHDTVVYQLYGPALSAGRPPAPARRPPTPQMKRDNG